MANSRRSEVRERLKREREAELRQARLRRGAFYGVLAAVGVGLVVLIVVLGSLDKSSKKTSDEDYKLGNEAAASAVVDDPYLQFGATEGKPVVDLYLDFTCPFCGEFHETTGIELEKKAAADDITLRVHPRIFLTSMTTTNYSTRAGIAFAAVYKDDPATALKYMDALFAEQPAEGSSGLTNGKLQDLAEESGSTVDVVSAIEEGRGIDWFTNVVEPQADADTEGTPYILVDETHIENWRDKDAILTRIEGKP